MTLDFSRCRLAPFQHQKEDVESLIKHPFFFVTNEMRTGKTKTVIDAAQFMYEMNMIDKVFVISPSPVRGVWFDQEMGEIAKHSWKDLPCTVTEFHQRVRSWSWQKPDVGRRLEWWITNYEFMRSKARQRQALALCGSRTLMVLDESSFVKGHKTEQTKAVKMLREKCGRVVLLNGTPISHSPKDLFSQGNILHPSILECPFITYFMARYAEMKPVLTHGGKQLVVGYKKIETVAHWKNLGDLQRRFAPYTVRRLQKDCLDLPPKLDPVNLYPALTPETWRMYKQMRDEMIVWLKSGVTSSAQAAVKVMRLRQITSGILGGIEDNSPFELAQVNVDADGNVLPFNIPAPKPVHAESISNEKLDMLIWFLGQKLEADPNFHVVIWSVFRLELEKIMAAIKTSYPAFELGRMMGGQSEEDRNNATRLLHPETSPKGPVCVGGIYGTGSFGLNFTAAHTSINCSFDYSLGRHLQAKDRVYGPGQTEPIAYYDIVATGPEGQKTIDHAIVAARKNNEDIANWTTAAWVKALREE